MRYEIGQQVICIENVAWDYGYGPKKDDIVTIERFGYFRIDPTTGRRLKPRFWLAFEEWYDIGDNGRMNAYAAKYFRPIVSDAVLTQAVSQIEEPQTV